MWEKIARYFVRKLPIHVKMALSIELLHEVLGSRGYSISDNAAVDIIETVVKSSGNRVIDFIVKGE